MFSISHNNKQKSKAVLIGINYRDDEQLRLRGCINDIMYMEEMLENAYGMKKEDMDILVDDGSNHYKMPTKNNIIEALQKAVDKSDGLRDLWIHYSGHGSYTKDTNGDELDGRDEYLVPCDVRQNGGILDDQLFEILNQSKCPVFLTIDCCHSGSVFDLTYSFQFAGQNRIKRTIEKRELMKNEHIYMLSGCRDNQTSDDVKYKNDYEGAFTRALIDVLKHYKYNHSLFGLYKDILYVLQQRGHTQRTLLSSSNPFPTFRLIPHFNK